MGTFRTKKFQQQAPKALLGLLPVRNLQQKTIVSKILADQISKVIDVIDETEKSVKVENRQTDKRTVERYEWQMRSS